MVVVDMTHHQQIDGEQLLLFEATHLPDFLEARFKIRSVHPSRPSIDHH